MWEAALKTNFEFSPYLDKSTQGEQSPLVLAISASSLHFSASETAADTMEAPKSSFFVFLTVYTLISVVALISFLPFQPNSLLSSWPLSIHEEDENASLLQQTSKDKPTFILHVGLPKTGTAFLQESLCSHPNLTEPMLLRDNYVYLGTCLNHPSFKQYLPQGKAIYDDLMQRSNVSTLFADAVNHLYEEQRNVIFVLEFFSLFGVQKIQYYADFLQSRFNVVVLINHRPLYESLPSLYNQIAKKARIFSEWPGTFVPGPGDWDRLTDAEGQLAMDYIPFDPLDFEGLVLGEYLSLLRDLGVPRSEAVRRNYQSYFENVRIIPMGSLTTAAASSSPKADHPHVDPLLEHMFCHAIPDAPNSCGSIRQGIIPTTSANPSVSFNYDMIAVAAYHAGLVVQNHSSSMTRQWTREQVRLWQEERLNRTSVDFPLECVKDEALAEFQEFLFSLERKMVGVDLTIELENKYRAGFAEIKKRAFCWPNISQVLIDPDWQPFFEMLAEM